MTAVNDAPIVADIAVYLIVYSFFWLPDHIISGS